MERRKRIERFLEFLLIGVAMGVVEDLLAVKLVTGEPITWEVVGIVVMVTVPFAAFSELVVDSDEFTLFRRLREKLRGVY